MKGSHHAAEMLLPVCAGAFVLALLCADSYDAAGLVTNMLPGLTHVNPTLINITLAGGFTVLLGCTYVTVLVQNNRREREARRARIPYYYSAYCRLKEAVQELLPKAEIANDEDSGGGYIQHISEEQQIVCQILLGVRDALNKGEAHLLRWADNFVASLHRGGASVYFPGTELAELLRSADVTPLASEPMPGTDASNFANQWIGFLLYCIENDCELPAYPRTGGAYEQYLELLMAEDDGSGLDQSDIDDL